MIFCSIFLHVNSIDLFVSMRKNEDAIFGIDSSVGNLRLWPNHNAYHSISIPLEKNNYNSNRSNYGCNDCHQSIRCTIFHANMRKHKSICEMRKMRGDPAG